MKYGILLSFIGLVLPEPVKAEIAVLTDFPGGSGVVESIDQENLAITINPADHPDRGWRCWWYVKLTGLPTGKAVTLEVGDAPWATPDQATFSVDEGRTWRHSKNGVREGKRIRYEIRFGKDSALVAWGPPFVPSDAEDLVSRLARDSPEATAFTLCKTREGRATPALRVSTPAKNEKPLVWIQARQHAWESGASWVGKGFAEWLTSDVPEAKRLREKVDLVFVPVMDIDNVFRGAGGKSQKPQDHNRDWSSAPHWNAVAAAQKEIREAAEAERFAMFIDLHNPGASDRFPYFYVPPKEILTERGRENQARFLSLVKEEMSGPLRFAGRASESGPNYDKRAWKEISKNWVALLGTDAVAVTLETAWNTPASTTEGYKTVGRQLGDAISRYIVGE